MSEDSSEPGSVSRAIDNVRRQQNDAASLLWARFADQITGYARRRIHWKHRRIYDAEDLVSTAFGEVLVRLWNGELDKVRNRNDLWRMLMLVVKRRNINMQDQINRRQPDDSLTILTESAMSSSGLMNVAEPAGAAMTPAAFAELNHDFARLIENLPDEDCKTIALMRVGDYSIDEIAAVLEMSPRTVNRKLADIRSRWLAERKREPES